MVTKLPDTAHTDRPWLIHEIAADFDIEDVWALPTPGGPGELTRLVDAMFTSEFPRGAPWVVRMLWDARWVLGRLFRWDRPDAGLGRRVPSLRERLPAELRALPPERERGHFRPLYALDNEWAAEIANDTVHAVLHLSWVPDRRGAYRGQLAVLVRPNGVLGAAYMAGIRPFRHLLVYPALFGSLERSWRAGDAAAARAV